MCFVNENNIERRFLTIAKRVDRNDLRGRTLVSRFPRRDESDSLDPKIVEHPPRLPEKFDAVREKTDPPSVSHGVRRNLRRDDGFAASSREHQNNAFFACLYKVS